ncbi:peritrophin-44 [Drosophila bipectinata]|uniref:peritrophin-44 n=1 Tax=Drosophila bipectinata TaxID=42026 RepID=UPI0038B3B7DD
MEHKCNLWSGSGYMGDPSDCRGWGFCEKNKLIERKNCIDGLFYNFRDGTCKKKGKAMCYSDLDEICASMKPEDYVANPADCQRFVKCMSIEDPIWSKCGEDQVFSNVEQKCIQEVSGCPQDNICSNMVDNALMAHPSSCKYYFKCYNGFATKMNCSADRYFNRESGHCQSWLPERCSRVEESHLDSPSPKDSHICSKYYQVDQLGEQKIPDMTTCYGYYTCTSQFDLGKWSSCPVGSHFVWWLQKCAPPEENSCSYDRCKNHRKSFVTTLNTGCREYTVCHNQSSIRSEKCPDKYPYFDEIKGQCGVVFPNHRVCYMNG